MTHFEALAIEGTATQEEIKLAYRRCASAAHPDRGGTTAKMQEINAAYATLSHPEMRAKYDATLPPLKPKSFVYTLADVGFAARGENFGQH